MVYVRLNLIYFHMFPKDQFCARDDTDLESKRPQLVTSVYEVLLTSYFYFSSKCSLSNIHKTRGQLFWYQVILRKRKFSTNFSNLTIQFQGKSHFYSLCFQLIQEKPTILLLLNTVMYHLTAGIHSEKGPWAILFC